MVSRRKSLQCIAGMGGDWPAQVPEFDRTGGRKDNVQRYGFTLAPRTGRPDLGGQFLLDARELVHIDVDHVQAVFEVEARVMTIEAVARCKVAAAEEIGGLVEVDIALGHWPAHCAAERLGS